MGLSISGVEEIAEASAQIRTEQMCQKAKSELRCDADRPSADGRYVTFQQTEVAVACEPYREFLSLIDG